MSAGWVAPGAEAIEAIVAAARFDATGLIAAIAQAADGEREVLMLAWMNEAALRETLATGRVCYYSRSRQALWRKGETSGQRQQLRSLRLDCDGDAVLMAVEQTGVACHTGRVSCFYREAGSTGLLDATAPLVSPETLYGR
ncbi:phosphoribosyl-AMP cyclohydrolase [Endobacter medicaginis]|uniref:Phosphoribosyl-AMP cyclohydrolase n=1 Tax=Endobacter medicaginis TaxID=1181271 RepID=A0A839UX61_9PROT|nr:phosphoribosyl-AMP cyclohydrolase [Endobacter medicaginis]MBB3172954.1 phosphoribosyl-AMP cyclohydrolase [Endobacter medicaginis]MCX5476239.1 phosphoribosyl-AMP cyclohydrolase [Endobacter medicaginis]NVN29696.1 phosphoribosyl-AMP cyclohydrolase [Endobacter medicaginis]